MEKVSAFGWKRRGDQMVENVRSPWIRVTLRQLIDVIPFLFRFVWYWVKKKWKNEIMFINSFQPLILKPIYGVPCGGIGTGGVGRDFRGGFCKFSLRPGLVEHDVVNIPANQFIVTVRHKGETVYQNVLNCASRWGNELSSWSFNFPGDRLHYTGLYPRAWETCTPATAFIWTVVNGGTKPDESYEVSITFTFRNGTGHPNYRAESVCHCRSFDEQGEGVLGIAMEHTIDAIRCTFALAAHHADGRVHVSRRCFNPNGDGRDLWSDLWDDGALDPATVSDWCYVKERKELAVALCTKMTVKPGATVEADTCLAWDMPIVMFGGRRRTYARRYTRWFGRLGDAAPALCTHALKQYRRWEENIDQWQEPILSNQSLPSWYKSAIFNELYFVTDGGTVWFEYNGEWRLDEQHLSDFTVKRMKEYGRFAYLESWEYRMLTTYDVHFYASFALASLWPEIELTVQAEFTDQIFNEDRRMLSYHFDGDVAPIKTKFCIPHDLGNPADDPWINTNAYEMHNTGKWRDLNLKYVVTCYRDYLLLANDQGQLDFLRHVWPAIEKLIEIGVNEWDADGDGMIENSGTCDQTYDAWKMYGTSAYCGGLWLAALKTAIEVGKILKHENRCEQWRKILSRALVAYNKKLWLGDYYKFDEHSRGCKSIMSDQLCGYWYLKSCGLIADDADGGDVLPRENVTKSLTKIFQFNVMKFKDGSLGAVNGMLPNGRPDTTSIQSSEVWTGSTYALASLFIQMGMKKEAFSTAGGMYRSIYDDFGMQYQTPEAVYAQSNYRALGYMRALAIWAMQWALDRCEQPFSIHNPTNHAASDGPQLDGPSVPLLNGE